MKNVSHFRKNLLPFLLFLPLTVLAEAPELPLFVSQMKEYGARHCAYLKDTSVPLDSRLAATYYDAQWIYSNIRTYTGDPVWDSCVQASEAVYRDRYVVPNNGNVPGYWNFGRGLTIDALKGDIASKSALTLLTRNAAYAPETTPLEWTKDSTMSREVAYYLMTALNAETLGVARTARYPLLLGQAFGHVEQWFGVKTAPYIRPFMVSLTAQALIENHAKYPDSRTIPAIRLAADQMWSTMWIPEKRAFKYTDIETDTGGTEPAPDLNLLIAPMYAWLYRETRDMRYLQQADAIFAGGVTQAYLVNAKQFNQNYRWSFDYLKWRESVGPIPTPVPTPTIHPCEKSPASTAPFSVGSCTNYFLKQIRDR